MQYVRLSCVNKMQLILYSFWLTDFDQFFDFLTFISIDICYSTLGIIMYCTFVAGLEQIMK